MQKTVITFAFLIVANYSLFSQENTFSLDYKLVNPYEQQRMMDMGIHLNYYLTDQFSLGAGIGFAGYDNTRLVVVPAFIDVRYNFKTFPSLFTYANIGMPLSAEAGSTNWLSDNYQDYNSGWLTNVGLGWKRAVTNRTTMQLSLGYQFFPFSTTIYKHEEALTDARIKHELRLQAGFEFSFAPVYGEKAKAERKKRRKEFWLTELFLLIFGRSS